MCISIQQRLGDVGQGQTPVNPILACFAATSCYARTTQLCRAGRLTLSSLRRDLISSAHCSFQCQE